MKPCQETDMSKKFDRKYNSIPFISGDKFNFIMQNWILSTTAILSPTLFPESFHTTLKGKA